MTNRGTKSVNRKIASALAMAVLCAAISACGANSAAQKNTGASQEYYNADTNRQGISAPAAATAAATGAPVYDTADTLYGSAAQTAGDAPVPAPDSGGGDVLAEPKIIMNGTVNMQSDNFDGVVNTLRSLPAQYGGYIESSGLNSYGGAARSFSIVMRVPRDSFEVLKATVESLGKVTSSQESSQDATNQYYDLAGRVKTLQIEEARVLEMIGKAASVEDLLNLEQRLGEIRTNIDVYQTQMTSIDRLSDYSTLNVYLVEVTPVEMKPVLDDLGGRIRQNFISSVNATGRFFGNVLVFLAGAAIPLAVAAILAAAGVAGYRYQKRIKNNK